MEGIERCDLWWVTTGVHDWLALVGLLDGGERRRLEGLRREADRERFVLAAALARAALGRRIGRPAAEVALDRRCDRCGAPHGKPRLRGATGPELSVTHSGRLVAVAVAAAPVGVDVEAVPDAPGADGLAEAVLADDERAALERHAAAGDDPARIEAFLRLWTRKEALTKMTGDGVVIPLRDVRVSGPGEPARLLGWAGRDRLVGSTALVDLAPPVPRHVAALAVGVPSVAVDEGDGGALLPL